jgi:hypothetical protein
MSLICSLVFAQPNDSLKAIKTQKNEIGLILNPFAISLLGGTPNGHRMGAMYKRALKAPGVYFTTGLYYQGYDGSFDNNNELTLEVNGLLRNIQFRNESFNKGLLSFGAEKRWELRSCPKIVAYLGLEYQFLYGKENVYVGNQWMKVDTTYGLDFSMQMLQPDSNFVATEKVDVNNIGMGLQLNAGLQFHLSKRFYLFAHAAPSFSFISSNRVYQNFIQETSNKYKTFQYNFEMRAVVSDVGLVYKF